MGFFVTPAIARHADISLSSLGWNGQGDGEFTHPYGVEVDPDRNLLFVADCWNHRVQALQVCNVDVGECVNG